MRRGTPPPAFHFRRDSAAPAPSFRGAGLPDVRPALHSRGGTHRPAGGARWRSSRSVAQRCSAATAYSTTSAANLSRGVSQSPFAARDSLPFARRDSPRARAGARLCRARRRAWWRRERRRGRRARGRPRGERRGGRTGAGVRARGLQSARVSPAPRMERNGREGGSPAGRLEGGRGEGSPAPGTEGGLSPAPGMEREGGRALTSAGRRNVAGRVGSPPRANGAWTSMRTWRAGGLKRGGYARRVSPQESRPRMEGRALTARGTPGTRSTRGATCRDSQSLPFAGWDSAGLGPFAARDSAAPPFHSRAGTAVHSIRGAGLTWRRSESVTKRPATRTFPPGTARRTLTRTWSNVRGTVHQYSETFNRRELRRGGYARQVSPRPHGSPAPGMEWKGGKEAGPSPPPEMDRGGPPHLVALELRGAGLEAREEAGERGGLEELRVDGHVEPGGWRGVKARGLRSASQSPAPAGSPAPGMEVGALTPRAARRRRGSAGTAPGSAPPARGRRRRSRTRSASRRSH